MEAEDIIAFESTCPTADELKKAREKLQKDVVDVISFRDCIVSDKEYKQMMRTVALCRKLRHLSLSIDQVIDTFRVQHLARALQKNFSLVGLHLYGNPITDAHLMMMQSALYHHPRLVCLDLGDCHLGDQGLGILAGMLKDTRERHGLRELILSHNTRITCHGWRRLAMSLASGSSLRTLHVDFNVIGDACAASLVTALPGATCLETLDMECTGITDFSGQLLLRLLQHFKLKLKEINIEKNPNILETTKVLLKSQLNHMTKADNDVNNCVIGSDDEDRSLTTSEPPLENAFQDYARRPSFNVIYVNEEECGDDCNFSLEDDDVSEGADETNRSTLSMNRLSEISQYEQPSQDRKKRRTLENLKKYGNEIGEYENTTDVVYTATASVTSPSKCSREFLTTTTDRSRPTSAPTRRLHCKELKCDYSNLKSSSQNSLNQNQLEARRVSAKMSGELASQIRVKAEIASVAEVFDARSDVAETTLQTNFATKSYGGVDDEMTIEDV
ncbi:uncharacterized protein LOC127846226 [Dreissena polymorpha]|nr:uncharacterized protein LOC127846226 [Dreissena polymorpha]